MGLISLLWPCWPIWPHIIIGLSKTKVMINIYLGGANLINRSLCINLFQVYTFYFWTRNSGTNFIITGFWWINSLKICQFHNITVLHTIVQGDLSHDLELCLTLKWEDGTITIEGEQKPDKHYYSLWHLRSTDLFGRRPTLELVYLPCQLLCFMLTRVLR